LVDVVAVRKLKRPVGSGIWSAYVLGVDEYGTWLHTPPGSLYRGHDGERTEVCAVAQDSAGAGRPIVQLIPPGAWWIATWYAVTEERVVTVDICTPAVLAGRTWTYVDLELDLWRSIDDGVVATDDWDEFRDACEVGQIRQDEAAQAIAAVATVEDLLRLGVEPFGREGAMKLTTTQEMALPPLLVEPAD
jgi:hypothetical protein